MLLAFQSLRPTAIWGLSKTGESHASVLRWPPPPRVDGEKAGRVWAWATPAPASIRLARGAVRPKPIMSRTNERRDKRPALTLPMSARISCSFIGMSSLWSRRSWGTAPGPGLCRLELGAQAEERGFVSEGRGELDAD